MKLKCSTTKIENGPEEFHDLIRRSCGYLWKNRPAQDDIYTNLKMRQNFMVTALAKEKTVEKRH